MKTVPKLAPIASNTDSHNKNTALGQSVLIYCGRGLKPALQDPDSPSFPPWFIIEVRKRVCLKKNIHIRITHTNENCE